MEKYVCLRKIEWIPEIKVEDVVEVYMASISTGSAMVVIGDLAFMVNSQKIETHFERLTSRRMDRLRKAMDL
jgi:hypothetical protein